MYIRDIMTTNVVTIPSNTSIADAKRIMMAHKFERLPVVDKGKLVGIVTSRGLDQVSPSKASSLTVWEMGYILERTAVKEIMERNVITVIPEVTSEEALALAQSNKVGSLVVLEDDKVVGIVTTNDFFYKIINPMLGVTRDGALLTGSRIEVIGGGESKALEEIISTINRLNVGIVTIHVREPVGEPPHKDVCLQLDGEEVSQVISALRDKGYNVNQRKRFYIRP